MIRLALTASLTLALTGLSHAGEIYVGTGFPRLIVGFAQPVSDSVVIRADAGTLGKVDGTYTEDGIQYQGTLKHDRAGLFADWFVAGGFRLTGGVTVNRSELDLVAQGNGAAITIGGTTYVTTPADTWRVNVKFPKTTPYLGLGYGRHPEGGSGFGFVADLGASIGRAKVTGTVSGPNLSNVSQADIDRELVELREGVGKVRVLPQLSVAVNYRF